MITTNELIIVWLCGIAVGVSFTFIGMHLYYHSKFRYGFGFRKALFRLYVGKGRYLGFYWDMILLEYYDKCGVSTYAKVVFSL